jgi:hypothetical protein
VQLVFGLVILGNPWSNHPKSKYLSI